MTRYKLILEYDGTNTVGWQSQNNGTSIQGLIADAVCRLAGTVPDVVACGRTDAGVHALAMPAHVDISPTRGDDAQGTGKGLNPDTVMRALNFHLGADAPVAVLSAEITHDNFHARFDCKHRSYRYVILNRTARTVLDRNRVWFMPRKLNVKKMRDAAMQMLGGHDWTSFRSSECQAKSPIKTVDEIKITKSGDYIFIDVAAKSFLHHMVRNIVGTLVDIGLGKPLDIPAIFAAKNRAAAGPTAPAWGLYFVSGEY